MDNKVTDIEIFNQLKRKLPFIYHNVNSNNDKEKSERTIIPTIPSRYLMTDKRLAVPFYKSISRMYLPPPKIR
jgi:hypothetical protein